MEIKMQHTVIKNLKSGQKERQPARALSVSHTHSLTHAHTHRCYNKTKTSSFPLTCFVFFLCCLDSYLFFVFSFGFFVDVLSVSPRGRKLSKKAYSSSCLFRFSVFCCCFFLFLLLCCFFSPPIRLFCVD